MAYARSVNLMLVWLVSTILIGFSASSFSAKSLDVNQPLAGKVVLQFADIYQDNSASLAIEQVLALEHSQWSPLTTNNMTYPITASNFWLKLSLSNSSKQQQRIILQHPTAFIHQLVLYDNKATELSRSSGQVPVTDRDVYDFLPAVKLDIKAQQQLDVYVLISQFYAEPMVAALRIYQEKEHQKSLISGLLRDGFIIVTLLGAAIILLVFGLVLKQTRLFTFIAYLIGLSFTIGYYTGVARWLFPFTLPSNFEPVFPITYIVTIVCLIAFSAKHINLRQHSPSLFKLYQGIGFSYLTIIVLIFAGIPNHFIVYVGVSMFFIPLLLAVVGWWVYMTKQTEKYLLIYAWGASIYALGMMTLGFFIFSGHPFALDMHHQGLFVAYSFILLDISLLSLSIATWLNTHQHHRRIAEQQAQQDPLTGLLNRRGYRHRISQLVNSNTEQRLWLAALDLDLFKVINDTYGHAAGDAVLVNVANILKHCSREHEIVARFGGEEFVVIFFANSQAGAHSYMERLREQIACQPTYHEGSQIQHSTSIGLVQIRQITAKSIEQAAKQSDQALYQAKQQGRNQVVVYQTESEQSTAVMA